jgi:hypothetical protein
VRIRKASPMNTILAPDMVGGISNLASLLVCSFQAIQPNFSVQI